MKNSLSFYLAISSLAVAIVLAALWEYAGLIGKAIVFWFLFYNIMVLPGHPSRVSIEGGLLIREFVEKMKKEHA